MLWAVLGSRSGMKGVQRAFGKGKLLVTLLSQCRWALFSANSLLALEACNLYPTFLTHDSSKRNIPAAFNSSASSSQAVNETGFEKKNRYLRLLFFFSSHPHILFLCQVSRSSSLSIYKRSLSNLPWVTSCAMARGSTSAGTASAAASVRRSSRSATAPSLTSRSWSTH